MNTEPGGDWGPEWGEPPFIVKMDVSDLGWTRELPRIGLLAYVAYEADIVLKGNDFREKLCKLYDAIVRLI